MIGLCFITLPILATNLLIPWTSSPYRVVTISFFFPLLCHLFPNEVFYSIIIFIIVMIITIIPSYATSLIPPQRERQKGLSSVVEQQSFPQSGEEKWNCFYGFPRFYSGLPFLFLVADDWMACLGEDLSSRTREELSLVSAWNWKIK